METHGKRKKSSPQTQSQTLFFTRIQVDPALYLKRAQEVRPALRDLFEEIISLFAVRQRERFEIGCVYSGVCDGISWDRSKEYGRAPKPHNSFRFCDFSGVYSPLCTRSPPHPPTEERVCGYTERTFLKVLKLFNPSPFSSVGGWEGRKCTQWTVHTRKVVEIEAVVRLWCSTILFGLYSRSNRSN